jgi:hypothetical protein
MSTVVIYYCGCRFVTLAGMQERRLLTIPQAAREIGMSRFVLWRHVRHEHLKSERHGPHVLIDAEELARFQSQKRRPGRPKRRPADQPAP